MVTDIEVKRLNYQQSINNIVSYKGYEFPGNEIHKRVLENIEDLDVREDDIFLISYPANGGHLLEDIVQSLVQKHLENNQSESDKIEINSIEQKTCQPIIARLEASNLYGHIRWLKSIKSPRLIATNLPYELLPQQLHTQNAKLIYVGRNCKDHIVAYYYHHRLKGIQITLDDFIDLYLSGYLLYGNYFEHVISYWNLSKLYHNNVLFICYEELKIITFTMAKLIVKFLNLNLNEKEIEEVIIKKQGKTNALNGEDLKQLQNCNRKYSQKLNKFHNVLGDWDNYLNLNHIKKIDYMVINKFESHKLYLTETVDKALKNIQNYGRIMKHCDNEKTKILNNLDSNNVLLTLTPRNKNTAFRKKLILTKDEAKFIRKKDKVIIVENNIDQNQNKSFLTRAMDFLCCCCPSYFKKNNYNKI